MHHQKYGSIVLGFFILGLGCSANGDFENDPGDISDSADSSLWIEHRFGQQHRRPFRWRWWDGAGGGGKAGSDGGVDGLGGAGGASPQTDGGKGGATAGSGGQVSASGAGGSAAGTGGQAGASNAGSGGSVAGSGGSAAGSGGSAAGSGGSVAGPLGLSIAKVKSNSVTVQWDTSQPATSTRVYVAPEPASTPGSDMPDQKLVATLDGSAGSQELADLAPAVDLFIRVARDTPQGTVSSDTHARTLGGPRAPLETPVRAVHAVGPHTLMIVLANGDGGSWQSGAWSVTRSTGQAIPVRVVRRHSIPVGAPQYQIGYGMDYSDSVLDVDHRLYLDLAESLGDHDMLSVQGPQGVRFSLPFSDRYLETPIIQVNQVGYNPRATARWAYVSGWLGDGGPLSFDSFPTTAQVLQESADQSRPRSVVLDQLAITQRSAFDSDAGSEVRQMDLSNLAANEAARYRVRIPGVGVSWRTSVSELAALKSFYVVTRGLFHNRWGVELKMPYTEWVRPADHTTVYTAEDQDFTSDYGQSTAKTGARQLLGGFHDAGDFDQRPMHTVVAELLMRAFELHPASHLDAHLTIPESGNGIPDLLDEALWGVSGWEQLQEADGGVRQGVQSWREPWGFYHADDDPLPYWTYSRGADVTARVAGLFAQASRLVAPFNASRSAGLRNRALQAWTYATSNGAHASYRLYAAGELFRLTSDSQYKNAFEQAWSQMGQYGAFSNFAGDQLYMGDYMDGSRAVADYILGYLGSSGASASIVSTSRSWLGDMADGVLSTLNNDHAHRSPRGAGRSQDWGNGATTAKYMDPIVAMLQLGSLPSDQAQAYFNALSLAADWVLGGNPNGYVYITGLGSRHVEEPLHLDSLVYVKEGMPVVPGIPVYGPIDGAPGTSYTAATIATYYPSFNAQPTGMRYGDVRNLVTCNEFTVWETQAPHAELFAALLGPALLPPASWLPGNPDHRSPLP